MDIGKQIVDTRVRKLLEEQREWFADLPTENHRISKAFLLLAVSCYLEREMEEVLGYLTESGNDCGIDALYLGELEDMTFDVILFQAKYKLDLEKEFDFPTTSMTQVIESVRILADANRRASMNPMLLEKYNEVQLLIWEDADCFGYMVGRKGEYLPGSIRCHDKGIKRVFSQ